MQSAEGCLVMPAQKRHSFCSAIGVPLPRASVRFALQLVLTTALVNTLAPVNALASVRLETRIHSTGDIWVTVTNASTIGSGHDATDFQTVPSPLLDQALLGINWIPSFEFPARTHTDYLYHTGFWFGCVRGTDTLVSAEVMRGAVSSDYDPLSFIQESSRLASSSHFDPEAHGDQQFYSVYCDTTWRSRQHYDYVDGRMHEPIGLEVHQTSYSWSNSFTRRFVIFDLWIKNISTRIVANGCVGLLVDADVYNKQIGREDAPRVNDDISGFVQTAQGFVKGTLDTVSIAWSADNDGDPISNSLFYPENPSGVLGMRILRTPPGGKTSFNWWSTLNTREGYIINWGPRRKANSLSYGAGSQGMPYGDRARYRMLTNGEQDYDQIFSAIDYEADGWAAPPSDEAVAHDIADGLDTQFLLSCGPCEPIAPGDSVPFSFALIAGANLHRDPHNFSDHFDYRAPQTYLNHLDLSDLILNARWADWYFDTPGLDTDGELRGPQLRLGLLQGRWRTGPARASSAAGASQLLSDLNTGGGDTPLERSLGRVGARQLLEHT